MYSFSISIDGHVPLKVLMTRRLRKITKIYLPISMILKMAVAIDTPVDLEIRKLNTIPVT